MLHSNFFKTIMLVCIILITNNNCKKTGSSDNNNNNGGTTISLKVLEDKTNKPISNATVSLEKCSNYDIELGCLGYSAVKTVYTNDSGIFSFNNNLKIEAISATHVNYWSHTVKNLTDIYLVPTCICAVHLIKTNNYSSGKEINVGVSEEGSLIVNTSNINYLPEDTLVYLVGYGNYKNYVEWYITDNTHIIIPDSVHTTLPKQINAFDTANVDINY